LALKCAIFALENAHLPVANLHFPPYPAYFRTTLGNFIFLAYLLSNHSELTIVLLKPVFISPISDELLRKEE